MRKARALPTPPPRDVYEFSLDGDEAQVYLRAKTLEEAESPLAEYIQQEHRHGGLYSLPPLKEPDDSPPGVTTPQKKKRKRCGVCEIGRAHV